MAAGKDDEMSDSSDNSSCKSSKLFSDMDDDSDDESVSQIYNQRKLNSENKLQSSDHNLGLSVFHDFMNLYFILFQTVSEAFREANIAAWSGKAINSI